MSRKISVKTTGIITIILLFPLIIGSYPEIAPAGDEESIFSSNHVLAYYGSPYTWKMGILGDHPPEKLAELLKNKAVQYDRLNNGKGVITAFHIVYATVQPKGELMFVNEEIVKKYIQVAKEKEMLVILDTRSAAILLKKPFPTFFLLPNTAMSILALIRNGVRQIRVERSALSAGMK